MTRSQKKTRLSPGTQYDPLRTEVRRPESPRALARSEHITSITIGDGMATAKRAGTTAVEKAAGKRARPIRRGVKKATPVKKAVKKAAPAKKAKAPPLTTFEMNKILSGHLK